MCECSFKVRVSFLIHSRQMEHVYIFSCLSEDRKQNAPLTFPLSDERLPPGLHVQTQVFHHAINAVVQSQTACLRLDGLSTDGTLVFLFTPLLDAETAEAVSAVQDDCLQTTPQNRS